MKISEMVDRLLKVQAERGDIDVMMSDPNGDGIYSVEGMGWRVAKKDEFPTNWQMPEGYEFVELS